MKEFHIYKDIRQRTNGEIYLGVVGPVRTGKSTFIRRFMEEMVIPHMEDGPSKTRSKDELPQAASGKNIMTTEPKFIPTEAAKIVFDYEIRDKDTNLLYCKARTIQVFMDMNYNLVLLNPDFFENWKARWQQ